MDKTLPDAEYRIFCENYFKICEFEREMQKTEKNSEEYERLLRRADELYTGLLQVYHYLVATVSITVAEAKIWRDELRNRKEA